MTSVLERRRPRPHLPARTGTAGLWLVTAATGAFFLAVVEPALRVPPHVDHLVVENPHPWIVVVEAAGPDGDGWVPVATVAREDSVRVDDVLDQGERWLFRFRAAGHPAGEVTVERSRLDAEGWRLTMPDAVAERLRDSGLAPSAR